MAWTNVGSLKGPKGDVGDASVSVQQGAIAFAHDSSPEAEAMRKSEEWSFFGKFAIYMNSSTHDIDFYPSSSDKDEHILCVFMKA